MEEMALLVRLALLVFAGLGLVVVWVVLEFLPTVAVEAGGLVEAALLVLADEGACLPILAEDS